MSSPTHAAFALAALLTLFTATAATAEPSHVVGVVRFSGKVPPPRNVDMSSDPLCAKLVPKPTHVDVVVEDGGLAEVFVYVKSGLPADAKYPLRTDKVSIDQRGCQFTPSVVGLQVGQKLELLNSDPLFHNVHGRATGSEFNLAMPRQGWKMERKLKKPQIMVAVICDLHPWMHAWIGSVSHPFFAVTDRRGTFALDGLPDGTFELELWHPTLGKQSASLTVKDGRAPELTITFAGKV